MIDSYLELIVNASESDSGSATRTTKATSADQEVTIEEDSGAGRKTSAMKQAQSKTKAADDGQKITIEHTVTSDDLK